MQSSAVAVVREYLDSLIVAGLLALLLISFVIRTYYIPSVSMVPTLAVADLVLVDELTYRFGGPQPGDIAVFSPPIASDGSAFIKRVIGVPGDTIRISDGIVYRNDTALVEPYANAALGLAGPRAGATTDEEARSYLSANCGFCHRPDVNDQGFDLRANGLYFRGTPAGGHDVRSLLGQPDGQRPPSGQRRQR